MIAGSGALRNFGIGNFGAIVVLQVACVYLKREKERERERDVCIYIDLYVYIHVYRPKIQSLFEHASWRF